MAEIDALEREYKLDEARISDLRKRQQEVADRIDEINLAAKPTFPTQEQRDGLAEAVRRIKAGVRAKSPHGDPTGDPEEYPYVVVVCGSEGWLNVRHGAPYTRHRIGEKLWSFTDEDAEAFVDILREHGLDVVDWWHCDGGTSFRTAAL